MRFVQKGQLNVLVAANLYIGVTASTDGGTISNLFNLSFAGASDRDLGMQYSVQESPPLTAGATDMELSLAQLSLSTQSRSSDHTQSGTSWQQNADDRTARQSMGRSPQAVLEVGARAMTHDDPFKAARDSDDKLRRAVDGYYSAASKALHMAHQADGKLHDYEAAIVKLHPKLERMSKQVKAVQSEFENDVRAREIPRTGSFFAVEKAFAAPTDSGTPDQVEEDSSEKADGEQH